MSSKQDELGNGYCGLLEVRVPFLISLEYPLASIGMSFGQHSSEL